MQSKRILVTGAAGFIGFHLSRRLLEGGHEVVGIDNLNGYYAPKLKRDRLTILLNYPKFQFYKLNIANRRKMVQFFDDPSSLLSKRDVLAADQHRINFEYVVHLAAQAGVRDSLVNLHAYIDSNISGFMNILKGCGNQKVKHFIFASSSSIYGANTKMPFSVNDNADHPVSLYGATKKANELMAHAYASLCKLPCTGLRFFTVYGPWGRPDMAYYSFTKAIFDGKPINVYNYGKMQRDFTYIDDIVEGIVILMNKTPESDSSWDGNNPNPATSYAPYRLYNIGNNNPIQLTKLIELLENCIGIKAKKNMMPMQQGDLYSTCADVDDLKKDVGFMPTTPIDDGVKRFVEWYKEYYRIDSLVSK
jgi:UDP-glucuronate 4-epimerase